MPQAESNSSTSTKRDRAAPPKMIKLFGGGERPETAADRREDKRLAAIDRKADASRVHPLVCDCDDPLTGIERAVKALHLICTGDIEESVSAAIYGLAETIGDNAENLRSLTGEIAHCSYSYAHGALREKVQQ